MISNVSGGSPVKSIQTFSIAIATGNATATASISSVNVNKSVLIFGGFTTGATIADDPRYIMTRAELTNATTVTATRNTGGVTGPTITGTVVEYN